MLCYKDRTFCTDTLDCANYDCHRRLSRGVIADAKEHGLPIAQASFIETCPFYKPMLNYEHPDCPVCFGTGEGDTDSSNCWNCGGSGLTKSERNPDDAYDMEREDEFLLQR